MEEPKQIENQVETHKFALPLSDDAVDEKIRQCIPRATLYKVSWAVNMFEEWRCERNERVSKSKEVNNATISSISLEKMSDQMLDKNLSLFLSL